MNAELTIKLSDGQTVYRPGESVRGTARWSCDDQPEAIEVRLGWYTEGKGTTDAGIVHTLREDRPGRRGENPFEFELPAGPYSFSGRLISLMWTVELVAEPDHATASQTIIVTPGAEEVDLTHDPDDTE